MKSGKILLGVLAGVAVGATLGILFAPAKGSSTRKKIIRKSDDYAAELEKKFSDFLGNITGKFKTFKQEAIQMAEDVKDQAEEIEDEVETVVK
jgi:gas vesicle protein